MNAMVFDVLEFFGFLVYAAVDFFWISTNVRQYMSYRMQGQFFIATYLIAFYGRENVFCLPRTFFCRLKTVCKSHVWFTCMHIIMLLIVGNGMWFTFMACAEKLPAALYVFLLMHWFVQINVYYGFMCFNQYCYEQVLATQTMPVLRAEYENVLRQLEVLNVQLIGEIRKRKTSKKPLVFDAACEECIICHEHTIEGGAVSLPCAHHFCSGCILQWFWIKRDFECPYCKQ